MTILPKRIYQFETLPISRGKLRAMQAALLHLIWAQKRHRISRSVLMASKSKGDLVVLDILKYYWSAHLKIPSWSSLFAYTKWMEIEKLWIALNHPNSLL